MFRAIRRLVLNLAVPAAVATPIAIGLAYTPSEPDTGPIPSPFAHLRKMHYGPDEIVYLLPDYTPIRFGDLPRHTGRGPATIPSMFTAGETESPGACSSPPG